MSNWKCEHCHLINFPSTHRCIACFRIKKASFSVGDEWIKSYLNIESPNTKFQTKMISWKQKLYIMVLIPYWRENNSKDPDIQILLLDINDITKKEAPPYASQIVTDRIYPPKLSQPSFSLDAMTDELYILYTIQHFTHLIIYNLNLQNITKKYDVYTYHELMDYPCDSLRGHGRHFDLSNVAQIVMSQTNYYPDFISIIHYWEKKLLKKQNISRELINLIYQFYGKNELRIFMLETYREPDGTGTYHLNFHQGLIDLNMKYENTLKLDMIKSESILDGNVYDTSKWGKFAQFTVIINGIFYWYLGDLILKIDIENGHVYTNILQKVASPLKEDHIIMDAFDINNNEQKRYIYLLTTMDRDCDELISLKLYCFDRCDMQFEFLKDVSMNNVHYRVQIPNDITYLNECLHANYLRTHWKLPLTLTQT
eukprot:452974_1